MTTHGTVVHRPLAEENMKPLIGIFLKPFSVMLFDQKLLFSGNVILS